MVDSSKVVRYKNAKVVKPGEPQPILDELWVQGKTIIDPQKYFYDVSRRADEEVDCKGMILAPGYIDIQCNGICQPFVVLEVLMSTHCLVARRLLIVLKSINIYKVSTTALSE